MRRLGVLMTYAAGDAEASARMHALDSRLRALGWPPGSRLAIDYHLAGSDDAKVLKAHATRLVSAGPDVVLARSTPGLLAARSVSGTLPIIFVQVTDPVGAGFVHSLAEPGGHITGFTDYDYDIGGKWIELLKETVPAVAVIAVMAMAGHVGNAGIFHAMEKVASRFAIRVLKVDVSPHAQVDLDAGTAANGMIVLPSPAAVIHRSELVALSKRRRLPAVFPYSYFAADGGLMSYGIDQVDQWTRAASYVDRILRGEKPASLPVQQPNKFELVINAKTAKALGIVVPPTLLARADEVIE
jgi:putative tryptophan/tyrosine transport system substrate-binding protein